MDIPGTLTRLVETLSKLPGIGEKTATRLAFYLVHSDKSYAERLAKGILDLKEKIKLCSVCMNLTESDPCIICSDSGRKRDVICVVEGPIEMMAVERTGKFKGLYHVLHGNLSPIDGVGPSGIRLKELLERLKRDRVCELIIATSPTVEGEGTALFVKEMVKTLDLKVTRIASGVPMGGELKFADSLTLTSALEGRRDF